MNAVLLVSHGSRFPGTKRELKKLVRILKRKSGIKIFEYAFLEIERPSISAGVDSCIEQGASQVIILMNFLNSGRHVEHDIPAIVRAAQKKYPNVPIKMTIPLCQHPGIVELFLDLLYPLHKQ